MSASSTRDRSSERHVPFRMNMASHVCRGILSVNGALPAETGSILLGPIGSNDITDFYFDHTAACSAGTYAPDHVTLNRLLKTLWMPNGLDFKGFAHSHPRGFDRLSGPDLQYIGRLLKANPDMTVFSAPIVLPSEYRLCPFVVHHDRPECAIPAQLILFST